MTENDSIFTIGHSTHTFERLLSLLRSQDIACLVDVRSAPGSRRSPHFQREQLERLLAAEGIAYVHARDLGGFRRPRGGSSNGGWRVNGFRGYADYMQSEQFAVALERLEVTARRRPSAIMCAEGSWRRCHRQLISDALVVRGWRVRHIEPTARVRDHSLTSFAVLNGRTLTYPPPQASLALDPPD
jgi:uncharacterized protein (DUF488 family)